MLSDVKNVDIMLGSYARNDEKNEQSERELSLDSASSRPQQNSNLVGEDFRSLPSTNSRENSEITKETTRIIGDETTNQVTRKFNNIRSCLNLQIQEAVNTAITEKVLPSIEKSLIAHRRTNLTMGDHRSVGLQDIPTAPNFTIEDHRSSGLQRNSEVINAQKTGENRPKRCFTQENADICLERVQ